ncbi:MAG: ComEC/Rec2 family competence protein, partial [Candidatus Moraniibacteriota bacterium]
MRKDQIFLLACLGYIGGVFVGSFFIFLWWTFLLVVALWMATVLAFSQKKIITLFVPLLFFACGIFSIEKSLNHFREGNIVLLLVSGTARVVNDPEEKSFFKEIIVKMESCKEPICPQEKILWQAPRTTEIVIGSRINFSCSLELPKNFDPAFDYRMFLAKDNIAYVCSKAVFINILPEDRESRFMRFFFMPKRAFEKALDRSIPQPEAGLAAGLIIGGNNRLPDTLSQSFVTAGLSHIVAISGYNIALIAQGFLIFGIALGLWRRQALWFAVVGIVFFIFLVGAPASAVRAGVMGVCAFGALFFGRLSRGINMLLLAGAVMLFFQPLLLRYDIGFQLSFLATLAIIVSAPHVSQLLPKEFFGKGFVEIALLTFSVELFVVPLIAYQFHIFSPFALLMNILLLPLVPYAMMASFVSVLGFFIFPGLHVLPAGVAYGILRIITYAVERLSIVPGSVREVSLSPSSLVLWYTFLFFIIILIRKHSL